MLDKEIQFLIGASREVMKELEFFDLAPFRQFNGLGKRRVSPSPSLTGIPRR